MTKKWPVLLVILFVLFGLILMPQAVFAQPEPEEEEETVQARPNPMEHTARGAGDEVMMKGAPMRNARERGLTEGNAVGIANQQETGMPSNGINSNGINSNGMLGGDQQKAAGKGLGAAESVGNVSYGSESAGSSKGNLNKQKLEGIDDETPNPMSGQAAMGMGEGGDDAPGNPIDPVTFDGVDGESVHRQLKKKD